MLLMLSTIVSLTYNIFLNIHKITTFDHVRDGVTKVSQIPSLMSGHSIYYKVLIVSIIYSLDCMTSHCVNDSWSVLYDLSLCQLFIV